MIRMSRKPVFVSRALGVASVASLLALGGCASDSEQQLADIRSNPTPELQTLTERPGDIKNQLTIDFNTEARSLSRDIGILFMTESPSRLSPYPVR